jgi:integrase
VTTTQQRTSTTPPGTVAALREHAARQAKERERACGSWVEGGHIFRMEIGSPLFPDVAGSLMRRTVEAMNAGHAKPVLPPMRLHDLRHVHATLLLKAGVPVHVVAARLGHADPTPPSPCGPTPTCSATRPSRWPRSSPPWWTSPATPTKWC